MEKQDIVAKYPKDISDYYRINSKFPDNFRIDEGFVCALSGERYFIHTRAVLPLKALESGVGFGLWVEVSRDDFMRYVNIGDNDELYKDFKCDGVLANEWPGFEKMKGSRVVVKTILASDKVYISEVLDIKDPLFQDAILTQVDNQQKIEEIFNLVKAYVNDPLMNQRPDF